MFCSILISLYFVFLYHILTQNSKQQGPLMGKQHYTPHFYSGLLIQKAYSADPGRRWHNMALQSGESRRKKREIERKHTRLRDVRNSFFELCHYYQRWKLQSSTTVCIHVYVIFLSFPHPPLSLSVSLSPPPLSHTHT